MSVVVVTHPHSSIRRFFCFGDMFWLILFLVSQNFRTIHWKIPIPIFMYVRLCDFDIPREKWLNCLQTVEVLVGTVCQLPFKGSSGYSWLVCFCQTSYDLVMPPTSKKLEGHIASGTFVRLSIHPLCILMHSITSEPCMLGF